MYLFFFFPVLKGTLRGYPLSGCVMDVPKGYTGIVLKETRPTLNSEESRTMRVISQFKQFTYWNWDRDPSRGDKYQQAMDWAEIADVVSIFFSSTLMSENKGNR